MHGEVHDENAYTLGGVAAHAGLFSTAREVGTFAHTLLSSWRHPPGRLVRSETLQQFVARADLVPDSSRGLGWDTPSSRSSAGRSPKLAQRSCPPTSCHPAGRRTWDMGRVTLRFLTRFLLNPFLLPLSAALRLCARSALGSLLAYFGEISRGSGRLP